MLKNKYVASFFFGFIGGFAFPPLYLLFFLPFSFDYLLTNLKEFNYKTAILFAFGYYLPQLYWVSFSLLVDKSFLWLFPFASVFVPLACSIYLTFAILILQKMNIKNRLLKSVCFAFLYVFFEYLRGLIFPWNFIAYTLAFSDALIQSASIFNIYVFDFIVVVFFCFWHVMELKLDKECFSSFKNIKICYLPIYLFIFSFILIFGLIRLERMETVRLSKKILLVQANIKQDLKWVTDELYNNVKKHIDISDKQEADVIIWAESSIPFTLTSDTVLSGEFERIKNKILISGANRKSVRGYYNSIFIFENNKVVDFYDKIKLVPFGEFMPLPFINKITSSIDFLRGDSNRTIYVDEYFKIKPLICYEIAFPNLMIDKNDRPDAIVNLTNDAWFGDTSGPYQHLVAAKFRAIENKIPVIRVANTGISVYINEYGVIENKINLNESGFILK
ncbi:MAG: apolipoprotein N-acyltransferase [Rickettsiales bacterium]|jgi:apolipoprotein N-acyltransferase|nr:apolipoprotein N-acyltransferase [Rickettsiales bacterium]